MKSHYAIPHQERAITAKSLLYLAKLKTILLAIEQSPTPSTYQKLGGEFQAPGWS
jgi:hypothetical protein